MTIMGSVLSIRLRYCKSVHHPVKGMRMTKEGDWKLRTENPFMGALLQLQGAKRTSGQNLEKHRQQFDPQLGVHCVVLRAMREPCVLALAYGSNIATTVKGALEDFFRRAGRLLFAGLFRGNPLVGVLLRPGGRLTQPDRPARSESSQTDCRSAPEGTCGLRVSTPQSPHAPSVAAATSGDRAGITNR